MRLTTTGVAGNFDASIVGIITAESLPPDQRKQRIRLVAANDALNDESISGYRALLCRDELKSVPGVPYVHRLRESDHLKDGDIVVLERKAGLVRSLYRPYEMHHHLFVTERCNSNCLMCSQPPKDRDDVEALTERNLELINLIAPHPPYLTITGRRTYAPRRQSFQTGFATEVVDAGDRTAHAHERTDIRLAGICTTICRA